MKEEATWSGYENQVRGKKQRCQQLSGLWKRKFDTGKQEKENRTGQVLDKKEAAHLDPIKFN